MEKISVIIPTYNRQEKVLDAINSVLQQTYKDIEVLVIDDCSTDNTKEAVEAIGDERVRYIRLSENIGAGGARNAGVEYASAELIAFHDSDDLWRPEKLEKQMKYWEQHPEYSMIYCAYLYRFIDGEVIRVPLEGRSLQGDVFLELIEKNCVGTPTMLMRKDCFFDVGGFDKDLQCLEDWEFVVRFAERYMIGYVDEVLVDAFCMEESVSSRGDSYCETRCYMIARYRNYLIQYNLFDRIVGDFFKKAANVGMLEKVQEMLQAFILADSGE